MAEGDHFVVRVEVKEVRVPRPVENSKGFEVKGPGGSTAMTERSVTDRLNVVVSAADEQEAVARAMAMLRTQMSTGYVQV